MKTYNWEGVNPDGYFLDKLEPIPSALPSFQKLFQVSDRKSGSAGMPRPISYAVFCLKKKRNSAKKRRVRIGTTGSPMPASRSTCHSWRRALAQSFHS